MNQLTLFDSDSSPANFDNVRRVWKDGQWRFSVVDAIAALTGRDFQAARKYWKNLKLDLKKQGADELVTNPDQLKMTAEDGKQRLTDVATVEQLLRIVQSVPSPQAEPFKVWLAKVGAERIEEQHDPEAGVNRALDRVEGHYQRLGRSQEWVGSRLSGIVDRRAFTDALAHALYEVDSSVFGRATGKVYKGVFHRTANELRADLDIAPDKNIRDYLSRPALNALAFAESLCAEKLNQSGGLAVQDALFIVEIVAGQVGVAVDELQKRLGFDIVTGRALLTA